MELLTEHKDLFHVTCCADAMPASATTLARDFGLRAEPSVAALIAAPDVELVIVVTRPPSTHRDLAVQALRAGKHVVVEKPMAENDAQCAEMCDAAATAGRALAVHHNRRWDIDFLTVRHLIESGALGRPRLVRNEYAAGFTGSPYDWGIHLIDQTMCLSLGRRFVEISASFCAPNAAAPLESEGFFSARLRTEDGVVHDVSMLPTFDGSAFRPGRMAYRFMVAGSEGIVYQDWCQRPEDAFAKPMHVQRVKGAKGVGDIPLMTMKRVAPDFYESLHAAIRHGAPVPVPGSEGRRAVRAWELICQSAVESRTLAISL
jgi:predicted dehydrogenase